MTTVFVAMSADIFHTGHLNIIKIARELGDVIVGLGTDEVNAQHKQMAFMSYEQRKAIIENIKGVTKVIPQPSLDLVPNLRALKPDFVVHGDDWRQGPLLQTRQGVIDVIQEWGGQLVEPPYTPGISSTHLRAALKSAVSTPEGRRRQLNRLLQFKPFVRIIEVYDGFSAATAEQACLPVNSKNFEFDALWLGASNEALSRGNDKPELVDFSSRLQRVQEILSCTSKPLIVDLGCSYPPARSVFDIGRLAAAGASGAALSANGALADLPQLIRESRRALGTTHFTVIVTSTIEQLRSAPATVAEGLRQSGVDGLLLPIASMNPENITDFILQAQHIAGQLPIFLALGENLGFNPEGVNLGIQAAVYQNNLLEASYVAMRQTAAAILDNSTAFDPNESMTLDDFRTHLQQK